MSKAPKISRLLSCCSFGEWDDCPVRKKCDGEIKCRNATFDLQIQEMCPNGDITRGFGL